MLNLKINHKSATKYLIFDSSFEFPHGSGNGALENLLILSCVYLFVIPDVELSYYNYDYYYHYYYTANKLLLRVDYQYIIYEIVFDF